MRALQIPRRYPELVSAVAFALVLGIGARFVAVSADLRAHREHEAAQRALQRFARTIQHELAWLFARARGVSSRAADGFRFTLRSDGTIDSPAPAIASSARPSASALSAADARGHGSAIAPGLYGPIRIGSRWVLAARVPVPGAARAPPLAWSVAYLDLTSLLARAKPAGLRSMGYDFEVVPWSGGRGRGPPFLSSRDTRLAGAVAQRIDAPAGVAQRLPSGGWAIAIAPRAGWVPLRDVASQMAVVFIVAWLAALWTHDLAWRSRRLREALQVSRQRLRAANAGLVSEIEEHRRLQKSLDFARYHDSFTGLPNRRFLMNQLDRALRISRTQRGYGIAVMMIEINRILLINEMLGQTAGDELMVQVARRFAKTPAPVERVIARYGGDTIAILLIGLHSMETATATTAMLQEALKAPFELRQFRVRAAASFGATWLPSGLQRAEDALREASIALSAAKQQGAGGLVVYQEAAHGGAHDFVHLEADLHVAIEHREFRLLFQPIVHLETSRIVGAEALLRWQHPTEGTLTPAQFLDTADDAGLMEPLTKWVIVNACRVAHALRESLPESPDLFVDVNLAGSAIRDPGLSDFVTSALANANATAENLRFDISEASLLGDLGASREMLNRLRATGVRLMLDDFGTGYTSLSYLQVFPFDYLKIDQTFVRQIDSDATGPKLLSALVQLASHLGLGAVAEGVETPHAMNFLRRIGCGYAQGYHISKPLSAGELLHMLRRDGQRSDRKRETSSEGGSSTPSPEPTAPQIGRLT